MVLFSFADVRIKLYISRFCALCVTRFFHIVPFYLGLVALNRDNVGLWLGRADGYVARDLFFFGINTAVRLGYSDTCVDPPLYTVVLFTITQSEPA